MARIRTLKPGFFTSLSLAKCSVPAMITFEGLWCEADDHGRGKADARLLKGAIWPLRDEVTVHDVDAHLMELTETGHIRLYFMGDEPYYEVLHWTKHQAAAYRRGEAMYPAPDEDASAESLHADACTTHADACTTHADACWKGREGKGREGINASADAAADEFEVFWLAYPNKQAKPEARRAFNAAKVPLDQLMAGLRGWCDYWAAEKTELRFVPYPQKFLRQRKWLDEPPPPPSGRAPPKPIRASRQTAQERAISVALAHLEKAGDNGSSASIS